MLLITLENACKIIQVLQRHDKEYMGIMHLHKEVSDNDLQKAIKKFTGEIRQLPPVRSAVARRVRTRNVYSFDVLERDGRQVLFRMRAEAGTYVRVVCHDIGKEIGGAHMLELRRTRSGMFSEEKTIKIQDLADAYHDWKKSGDEKIRDLVLPVEAGIEHLPKIIIKDSAVFSVASGSPVYATGISKASTGIKAGETVAVLTLKGELVALAKADMSAEDMIRKKGLAAKTDRVIIDKNLYTDARR